MVVSARLVFRQKCCHGMLCKIIECAPEVDQQTLAKIAPEGMAPGHNGHASACRSTAGHVPVTIAP